MFTRIEDFLKDWSQESSLTQKVLAALTDASLATATSKDDRPLGRVAWHIVTSVPEMLGRTGLPVKSIADGAPMPATAAEIAAAYKRVAAEAAEAIRNDWKDETLLVEDNMYGMQWPRGVTLEVLLRHEIHHRAQITVLMRLAGLAVPGVYGPAREEWAAMGMPAPEL